MRINLASPKCGAVTVVGVTHNSSIFFKSQIIISQQMYRVNCTVPTCCFSNMQLLLIYNLQIVQPQTPECVSSDDDVQPSDTFMPDPSGDDLYSNYIPPINDHEDEQLDLLLADLQSVVQTECREDLADDLATLADDVLQAAEHETEEMHYADEDKQEDPLLYDGSRRHLGVVMLLLSVFMIRFRLSDETMQYLLVLLQLLLPENNTLVRSLYSFKAYLGKLISAPTLQYYCAHCYTHVGKEATRCTNEHCMKDLTVSGAVAYFVLHSMISQLQVLFKRKHFTEQIREHRFNHFRSKSTDTINDVYDGKLYQNLYNKGILNNPNNLSFAMSTDGVAIFKSSKISMWPVYMLINELPIAERKSRENILFYGIWISPRKPMMWSFLKPMFEELRQLEEGVNFVDHNGEDFKCQAGLLTCTCDLPAKALVANSIQFNGRFGCWHCLQKGQNFRTTSGGNCHVFPYNDDEPSGPKRTIEDIERDVKQVMDKIQQGQKDYVTNGIKGPSWLMYLSWFDFANGFVIDYMHGICGGVTKSLLKLWFTSTHKREKYSFFNQRQKVSDLLKNIKPTINITRVPRGLDDLAFWKASEFRNFLLYWSIPVLRSVLDEVYLMHYILLVRSIYLLSKASITEDDLHTAQLCIDEFLKQFQHLYSLQFMTMNIHQIVHLVDVVRLTGPLFANNSFVFEDINGFIVSHIHGTQGVDTQVIKTINIIQAIPILHEQYAIRDDESVAFIENMSGISRKSWKVIDDGIYRMDLAKERIVSPDDFVVINQKYTVLSSVVKCWNRIYMKKSVSYIYAKSYKKLIRRNQSVVKYMEGDVCKFGSIDYFAEIEYLSMPINIALVNPFQCVGIYNPNYHIHCFKPLVDKVDVVDLKNILTSCVHVKVGSEDFICEFPNRYEQD